MERHNLEQEGRPMPEARLQPLSVTEFAEYTTAIGTGQQVALVVVVAPPPASVLAAC